MLSPHFIPNTLHFREHQIREMMSILAPALQGKKPRNLMIYGKTGTGKCVHGDTPILLANGTIKKARDIFSEAHEHGKVISDSGGETWLDFPFFVQSWNPKTKKIIRQKVTRVYRQKSGGSLLKILTATGREITVTGNHPFFIINEGKCEEIRASALKPGTCLPVLGKFSPSVEVTPSAMVTVSGPRSRDVHASSSFTPDIAEFMGYQIGDGCETIPGNRVIFANSDPVLFNRFRELASSCFSIPPGRLWDCTERTPQVCISSSCLRKYMEQYLGYAFGRKSAGKDIPDQLMHAPDNVVTSFLRAIFDCEGSVSKRDPVLEFTSASRTLANKVSYLLARFGIVSIIKIKKKCATNTKERKLRDYYTLLIYGTENLGRFHRKIGFLSKEKMKRLESKLGGSGNPNIDVIPGVGGLLRDVRLGLGISASEFGCRQEVYPYEWGTRHPSASKLNEFVAFYNEKIRRLDAAREKLLAGASIFDVLPEVPIMQKELVSALGIKQSTLSACLVKRNRSFEQKYSGRCRDILLSKLDGILHDKRITDALSELKSHISSDVIWDEVVSVTEVGNDEGFVYDFEVPDTHTFIGGFGGIVSHNTCCTKHVAKKFEEENPNAKIIYVNCRMYNKPYRILSKAIKSLTDGVDKQGYGLPFYYEKMLEWCGEGRQLVLILDEIDMAKNIDELIYTLTRANDELKKGGVTLIGISNRLLFKEELDPRSKSSLYEREMVFPPYTAPQLQKILQQRAEMAFKDGVISAGAINLASAFTAQDSGDARYALKLLSRAAEFAEERNLSKITDSEVKEARDVVETDLVKEAVDKLPEHHQLVLYAVARLTLSGSKYARFEEGKDGYLFSGDVYEDYAELCSKLRKASKTARSYRSYLNDLEMLGLVTTVESGKGIRGHTKLIKLGHTPQETVSMMRQKFGE